jgi:hypothetical protein
MKDWQVAMGIVPTPEFEALQPMIRRAMRRYEALARDATSDPGDGQSQEVVHAYAKALIAMCWMQGYEVERPKLKRLSHDELLHLFQHILYLVQYHQGIWDDDDPLPKPIQLAAK